VKDKEEGGLGESVTSSEGQSGREVAFRKEIGSNALTNRVSQLDKENLRVTKERPVLKTRKRTWPESRYEDSSSGHHWQKKDSNSGGKGGKNRKKKGVDDKATSQKP